MPSLDQAEPTAVAAGPRKTANHHLTIELTETLKLAAPMALTQLGQIAMTTTDLVLIGRIGDEAVAAAGLANTVYFIGFTLGMGLMAAVAPLAAQAFGAGEPAVVRRALRTSLWVALLVSLPIMAFPLRGEAILRALGQAPATSRLAQDYLFGLAWGVMPALWFQAIRSFMGAVNRPQPILWITLAAIPANALIVYLLIYGAFGLPKLGLFGAGIATTTVNFATFLAGLWFVTRRKPFSDYRILTHLWRIDWTLVRQIVVVGAPISIAILLEYGVFSSAGLLMGLIGTSALAAHQIALQVASILFMVPLGIGMSATIRVGHAVGRNDAAGIKRAGYVAILLATALSVILTLAVIFARTAIVRLFLGDTPSNGETGELAEILLTVGATLFITDGLQGTTAGALRGLKDTRIPLLIAAVSYWLIGFPAAYTLGFFTPYGAAGVWIGLSVGTGLNAKLLLWRFRRLAHRHAGA